LGLSVQRNQKITHNGSRWRCSLDPVVVLHQRWLVNILSSRWQRRGIKSGQAQWQ
jgi:hypothetical protein